MTDKEQLEMALALAESAARMLNLPDSNKLHMLKVIAATYSVPLAMDLEEPVGTGVTEPTHEGPEPVSFSTTEMLRQRGKPLTPAEFSKKATELGYLREMTNSSNPKIPKRYRVLTEKGLPFGKNVTTAKGETRVYWYIDTFTSLLKLIS